MEKIIEMGPYEILETLASYDETLLRAYEQHGHDQQQEKVLAARIQAMRAGAEALRGQNQAA